MRSEGWTLVNFLQDSCRKTVFTKELVKKKKQMLRSEGWTLVNFKLVNAKARMNRTVLNRILHEKTLPKIICFEPCSYENALFHKCALERRCSQKLLLKNWAFEL